jgi:hypothetical protein
MELQVKTLINRYEMEAEELRRKIAEGEFRENALEKAARRCRAGEVVITNRGEER